MIEKPYHQSTGFPPSTDIINGGKNEVPTSADNIAKKLDTYVESLLKQDNLDEYDNLRITNKTDIQIPPPLVTINKQTIVTTEALSTISGQSKSGKSAITGALIAGAISQDSDIDGFPLIEVRPNFDGKAVIHIDTEQARHKQQSNLLSILKRAKLDDCPPYFLSYNIRQLNIGDYAQFTDNICRCAAKEFDGIHSIWIDGGADYVEDVNDAIKSNAIIKFFEDLAIRYKTAVIIIVHTNPNGDKERGHFGSTCQRKSESVLIVKKNGTISTLEAKFLRNAGNEDIPRIEFAYNPQKGYHTYVGIGVEQLEDKSNHRINTILQCHKLVFGGHNSYSYKDAINAIKLAASIGERTAKDYFSYMKSNSMIYQCDNNKWQKKEVNKTGANDAPVQ
ncbi:MAG TPA: hypothetical protein DCQ50_16240 [Chryseobacterium sp.]|nr:hypothetical protein [Chryseobacterium sp.]